MRREYPELIGFLSTDFAGSIVPDYPPKLAVTVSLIPLDTNVEETVTLYAEPIILALYSIADHASPSFIARTLLCA